MSGNIYFCYQITVLIHKLRKEAIWLKELTCSLYHSKLYLPSFAIVKRISFTVFEALCVSFLENPPFEFSWQPSWNCCKRATKPSKNSSVFRTKNLFAAIIPVHSSSKVSLIKSCRPTSWFIKTASWIAKHRTWHSRRSWYGHWIHELYERRDNINCKKYDLVNKQIDTDCKQLNSKLCDLIYLLVAMIFCHIWRGVVNTYINQSDRAYYPNYFIHKV